MSNHKGEAPTFRLADLDELLGAITESFDAYPDDVGTISDEDLVADDTSDDPHIGRELDSRYRIESLLAVGGMGRVYRARQKSLDRVVAVKLLALPSGGKVNDPEFEARFALEAATASQVNHPNTVTIFDYGSTIDGVFYIVMEFIEGASLARVLRAERRLCPARALHITRQICRGLRVAHDKGIIHRDLKPSNILLVRLAEEEGDVAKILDFGLAKLLASCAPQGAELTRVGTFIGTPEYAAPEVPRWGMSDRRSDIYSVGVLLYRMLTGKVPFRGTTNAASLIMAVQDPVPPIDPDLGISGQVTALVMRCLEKAPDRRYQSMDELVAALATCLDELGVEAPNVIAPPVVAASVVAENRNLATVNRARVVIPPPWEVESNSRRRFFALPILALLVLGVGIGVAWVFLGVDLDRGPASSSGGPEAPNQRDDRDNEKQPADSRADLGSNPVGEGSTGKRQLG